MPQTALVLFADHVDATAVEGFLDRASPQQRRPWHVADLLLVELLRADDRHSPLRDLEPEELEAIVAGFGHVPMSVVQVDAPWVLEAVPAARGLVLDLDLLRLFGGAAVDDYSAHLWTLHEIDRDVTLEGGRFFTGPPR